LEKNRQRFFCCLATLAAAKSVVFAAHLGA